MQRAVLFGAALFSACAGGLARAHIYGVPKKERNPCFLSFFGNHPFLLGVGSRIFQKKNATPPSRGRKVTEKQFFRLGKQPCAKAAASRYEQGDAWGHERDGMRMCSFWPPCWGVPALGSAQRQHVPVYHIACPCFQKKSNMSGCCGIFQSMIY